MNSTTEFATIEDAIQAVDPDLKPGVQHLVTQVDPEDLDDREPRDTIGALTSMRTLADRKADDETLVSVFTPTLRDDGWTSQRTIVNICTSDSPFLVDSVTAAITRHGLTVHRLLHPVVSVRRDETDRLTEVGAHGGDLESWIHIEADRIATDEGRHELEERLRKVLSDVRAAVQDWRPMRRACLDIVTDLRTAPPGVVDPDTVPLAVDFLNWLADDNFTFLGYREYTLETDTDGQDMLLPIPNSGLGILAGSDTKGSRLRPEAQQSARHPRLLTVTKANSRATVHRDVYLDYIGVRTFDEKGNVTGERRFLGMFTSMAYAASVTTLPIVSAKVKSVLEKSGFSPTSHSGKHLMQILEEYPRDELFQDSAENLLEVATEVRRLYERRRARIFLRRDEFGRFASALVFLPKDRYNTTVRLRTEELLRTVFGSEQVDYTTRVGDTPLAQLHFVVRAPKGNSVPEVDLDDLQRRFEDAIRSWEEGLVQAVHNTFGEVSAASILNTYGDAFPESYKESVTPEETVKDIQLLEALNEDGSPELAVHLYVPETDDPSKRVLTVTSGKQYPLTRVLPVLTDLGVDVVDERPYSIHLADGRVRHISDFGLTAPSVPEWSDPEWGVALENAFLASWTGAAESDKLNTLVLLGGLDWRRIVILRAIAMYIRQIGTAFSVEYIDQVLVANPTIARDLVRLFEVRFDPDLTGDRNAQAAELSSSLREALEQVASLDADRILRLMIGVIEATWRTNFYQPAADGTPKPWVSMKLDCSRVPGLPKPLPMAEIWVYSPEVEGVHLRFGAVARGGLRWSDRREDFRTEVQGLVKAQMTKNAVIVPTGSKGGFVAKQLPDPSDRAAWLDAGKNAYRTFIRGMLDITDNRAGSSIVPPERVVRHDGDDTYLVVAADKGTASFSDIANEISEKREFWLGDAFASGGSAGYDHKGMGITARGAWESVKRHFRELGHDTQAEDFTVVGIGDMSGDVFGNGMLRSEHIRLIAAFDHRHVFVDPDPDAASSFAERKRLFELPGSSWDDYDRDLISEGGGVFPLTAKSISVTNEMRRALGLGDDVTAVTPAELKRAVLLAPVDLLWNGAIGTYIKSSAESHSEIGDRANDAVRVNGNELRLRVVGEGGNLGVSQQGRIEAAMSGVRINTDAIDNSAGVGTSDREVNIKILLGSVMRDGRLDREERDRLLQSMTDEVGHQVLRDNYEQNVLLGNSRANAAEMLPSHERLIEWLEARDDLERELESLPNRDEIAERIAAGQGLMRPEFAVLVAYSKLALKADLAATDIAEDPWFSRTVADYFPEPLRGPYAEDLDDHPLRSDIIVNSIVNSMVNRGGITFAHRAADETGASSEQIARAYVVAREIFGLHDFVSAVEATDNVVSTDVQTELYLDFRRLLDRATRWLVQHRTGTIDIGAEIDLFSDPVQQLIAQQESLLRGSEQQRFIDRTDYFERAGVPTDLARRGAGLLPSISKLDIAEQARLKEWNLDDVADVYFATSAQVQFTEMLTRVTKLPQDDRWGSMARAAMRDDLYAVMRELTASVISHTSGGDADERVATWLADGGTSATRALGESHAATQAGEDTGLATMSVALRRLRSLVR